MDRLSASVEELEESAAPGDLQISGMNILALSDCILVEVTLDTLNHLNLFSFFIKCDGMWVVGAEENFEDLEGVTIKGVTRDLLFKVC